MADPLHTDAAYHHNSNSSDTLCLEKLYGSPVLLSGIASLVLSNKEIRILYLQHKSMLCRLQKLNPNTPDCVIFFLAGQLPITATIHLRQFGLLGMIARLSASSILHNIGTSTLLSSKKEKSWFQQIRDLSCQYGMPDPLAVLQSPADKEYWKRFCKSKVVSWWEEKLRQDVPMLPSLVYFKPAFMSLTTVHPLWSLAESPFEVQKAASVASMLSGRYVTDYRSRHWSKKNPNGLCQLCLMNDQPEILGTLEHLLLDCPVLSNVRGNMKSLWSNYVQEKPILLSFIESHMKSSSHEEKQIFIHFLLDPSSCPEIVRGVQVHGIGLLTDVLYLTRTWCHSIHAKRIKLLKLYNVL